MDGNISILVLQSKKKSFKLSYNYNKIFNNNMIFLMNDVRTILISNSKFD